jgi:hypothetical protein
MTYKKLFDELDKLNVYFEPDQEYFYLVCRDKFYRTGELNHDQTVTLQNILHRASAVSSEPKAAPVPRSIPSPKDNDEIKDLFDALFSYKDVTWQSHHYIYVIQAHKKWTTSREAGGGVLSWDQKYQLHEILKWLEKNYPDRH